MSDSNVLQIRGLKVAAPNGAILVDNVDLDLKRGEVKGLIGESGAGKSTIGLAAMGYGRNGCRIETSCRCHCARPADGSDQVAYRSTNQPAEIPRPDVIAPAHGWPVGASSTTCR